MFAWSTKWTFDPFSIGSVWPGRFFTAQADSILYARLWVNPADIPGECFYHDGQCDGYFGLFPSLLRIPFVIILGPTVRESTALFISIAASITFWAALDLRRRVVDRAYPKLSTIASVFMLAGMVRNVLQNSPTHHASLSVRLVGRDYRRNNARRIDCSCLWTLIYQRIRTPGVNEPVLSASSDKSDHAVSSRCNPEERDSRVLGCHCRDHPERPDCE